PNYHAPRNPVVLCHGLFGYDYKGFESMPALQLHYWRGVKATLEKLGATVYVARVASTGNVRQRAEQLHALLSSIAAKSDSTAAATAEADGRPRINLVGHSMGGLDGRYLVSHVRPHEYDVVSLTTVATPHRGSPFMDWCRDVLGLASIPPPDGIPADTTERIRSYVAAQLTGASRSVVDALTACLQLMADKPAYIFLTTDYCKRVFNPNTPDSPRTRYYSYGAIADPADIGWLTVLKFTQSVVSARAGPNDGVVPHNSSRWGTYVETLPADHFALTGRGPGLADALDGLAAYMSSASSLLTSAELLNVLRKNSASGSSGRTAAFSPLSSSSSSSSSSAASPAASASFNVNDFYAWLCTRLYRDGF
ncbi:alpha/beta-hydrolase, partial [Ramicandelaber brevisporus]